MMPLTVVTAALQRLSEVYALPQNMPREPQRLAVIYARILEASPAVHPDQLEAAVSAYMASDEAYFPKPGKLRALALQHRGPSAYGATEAEYRAWELTWGRSDVANPAGGWMAAWTPCPVCAAVPGYESGRLRVRHLAHRHREAGVSLIGHSDEIERFYATKAPDARAPEDDPATRVAGIRARIAAYERRLAGEQDPETRRLLMLSLDRWRMELQPAMTPIAEVAA